MSGCVTFQEVLQIRINRSQPNGQNSLGHQKLGEHFSTAARFRALVVAPGRMIGSDELVICLPDQSLRIEVIGCESKWPDQATNGTSAAQTATNPSTMPVMTR
jgi:hypothetical protein